MSVWKGFKRFKNKTIQIIINWINKFWVWVCFSYTIFKERENKWTEKKSLRVNLESKSKHRKNRKKNTLVKVKQKENAEKI